MALIIAEAGVNHNGDLELAKKLIDAAKFAGADIIKFQTFKTELGIAKNTPLADYQKDKSKGISNQYDLVKSLELEFDDFKLLKDYSNKIGIEFLSTAFDIESIKFLRKLELKRFKIPSGEIDNYPYLREIAKSKKPIILSTGMSNLGEIKFALETLIKYGAKKSDITVLQCVTEYPAPKKYVNLNTMKTISESFNVNIGYSDHTEGIEIAIYAAILGATIIEKHLTLDRNMIGPDHSSSLEPHEFKKMIREIRDLDLIMGNGIKKPSICELKNIKIVRKSIFAKNFIKKGEKFGESNLIIKRPGTGLSPRNWNSIIGRKAHKDYCKDEMIIFN